MKRGKHAKTRREQRKENAKKELKKRFGILILCVLFAILVIQIVANKDYKIEAKEANIEQKLEQEANKKQEENEEEKTQENQQIEETLETSIEAEKQEKIQTEATEDEKIKNLIAEIKTKNNLTTENFAFFYYNPQTKKYYFDNKDKYFKGASTVKVPVAMLYYDKIRNGEFTEEKTLNYTSEDYEVGGGTTSATYKVGDYIPISFLLKQSIINSDNTAVNILIDGIGYTECRKQIAKYSDEQLPEEFYSTNLTSAGYGYDVINHIFQNQENYQELIGYMKQSSNGEYLKKYINEYDVAHKYGSYDGNVHDYGIVYSESPYLIGVFTDDVPGADELIANISRQVLDETKK